MLLPRRAHRHRVLADGDADAEPRAEVEGHRLHGVEEGGVLAGGAGGRHPVGRELDARERRDRGRGEVGEGLADRHAPGGGAVDDRDRRALAHGEGLAGVALEGQQRRRAVGDRHLPRADHRVARAEAAHRAVADRDQERLVRHRGVEQDAPDGLGEVDAVGREGAQLRAQAPHVPRHARRLAEEGRQVHVHRLVAEERVAHLEVVVVGGDADDRERAALALAERAEEGRALEGAMART